MAYPYYPGYYGQQNPYYQQQIQQQMAQQQAQQQAQQPTIQQSGFVLVPSEQEARNYPVAPGNSVTFKDENAPYCYVKTMGFNQFDQPRFERYRLVKEPDETHGNAIERTEKPEKRTETQYATKTELDALKKQIEALKEKLSAKLAKEETEDE